MSSDDVANYLDQVGNTERKLEYCRQILTGNPSFIPQKIFTINFNHQKHSLNRQEFAEMVKSVSVACNEQESELLFTYFQIDGKEYITCEQFILSISSQTDPHLSKILSKRETDNFVLDYSLKFSLEKYLRQVIDNQIALELKCNFGLELDHRQKDQKRLDCSLLKEFMRDSGKYPSQTILNFIWRQISKNKGNKRRHQLICQYIYEYTQKKSQGRDLPKVIAKVSAHSISLPISKRKISETKQNIQRSIVKPTLPLKKKSSSNNSEINWSSFSPVKNNKKQKDQRSLTPAESLNDIEKRIKILMGEVTEEQKNIVSKSKLDQKHALRENNPNITGQRIHKSSPRKQTSFKEESPRRQKQPRNMNKSQLQMAFSSIQVPFSRSSVTQRSSKSSERQMLRKKFNLKESSPQKHARRQTQMQFGKIVEESRQYCDSSHAHDEPEKKVEKKIQINSNRPNTDLSRYSKYNYLPEAGKKDGFNDRIKYLKKLVGDKL